MNIPVFNMLILTMLLKDQVSVLLWLKPIIKSAFRILPINPQDFHLLGRKWSGQYYYDKCMSMGCSSSCKTFETLVRLLSGLHRISSV